MSIKRLAPDKPDSAPALVTGNASEIHAVRFILDDRAVSFPRAAFEHWERSGGAAREQMRISLGSHAVLVGGQHLAVLHDALDAGTARTVGVGSGGGNGVRLYIGSIQLVQVSPATSQPR